jgi:hypothetical protein
MLKNQKSKHKNVTQGREQKKSQKSVTFYLNFELTLILSKVMFTFLQENFLRPNYWNTIAVY